MRTLVLMMVFGFFSIGMMKTTVTATEIAQANTTTSAVLLASR